MASVLDFLVGYPNKHTSMTSRYSWALYKKTHTKKKKLTFGWSNSPEIWIHLPGHRLPRLPPSMRTDVRVDVAVCRLPGTFFVQRPLGGAVGASLMGCSHGNHSDTLECNPYNYGWTTTYSITGSVPPKCFWWLSPRRLRFNLIWPRKNWAGYDFHMDFFIFDAQEFFITPLKSTMESWHPRNMSGIHGIHLPSEDQILQGFNMEAFTIWLCLKMAYHTHKSVVVLMGIWECRVGGTLFYSIFRQTHVLMVKPHVWCWNRDVFVVFHHWQVSLIWIRKKTITSGRITPVSLSWLSWFRSRSNLGGTVPRKLQCGKHKNKPTIWG